MLPGYSVKVIEKNYLGTILRLSYFYDLNLHTSLKVMSKIALSSTIIYHQAL